MTDADSEISAALAVLEATFARYDTSSMTWCDCGCNDDMKMREIMALPPSKVGSDGIRSFAFSITNTILGTDAHKALLPFILGTIADDRGFIDTEIVFQHLLRDGFLNWPAQERAAVRTFLIAFTRAALTRSADGYHPIRKMTELLHSAISVGMLDDVIATWRDERTATADLRFADVYYAITTDDPAESLAALPFGSHDSGDYVPVAAWLRERETLDRAERGIGEMYADNDQVRYELLERVARLRPE